MLFSGTGWFQHIQLHLGDQQTGLSGGCFHHETKCITLHYTEQAHKLTGRQKKRETKAAAFWREHEQRDRAHMCSKCEIKLYNRAQFERDTSMCI